MYNKILVPTDGSPSALAAAEFASDLLAAQLCRSMTLLVVVSIAKALKEYPTLNPTQVDEDIVKSKLRNAGHQIIGQTRAIFEARGLSVDYRLEMYDDPGKRIIQIAREDQFDLIIMGNRGRSLVQELIIGSVSNKVLQDAECPVVIYKK